jgi:hypothetical protein
MGTTDVGIVDVIRWFVVHKVERAFKSSHVCVCVYGCMGVWVYGCLRVFVWMRHRPSPTSNAGARPTMWKSSCRCPAMQTRPRALPPSLALALLSLSLSLSLFLFLSLSLCLSLSTFSALGRSWIFYSCFRAQTTTRASNHSHTPIPTPTPTHTLACRFKTSIGTVQYFPEKDCVVWSIKQFEGQKEYFMRTHFGSSSFRHFFVCFRILVITLVIRCSDRL